MKAVPIFIRRSFPCYSSVKNFAQLWRPRNISCSRLLVKCAPCPPHTSSWRHSATESTQTVSNEAPPWNILFFGSDAFSLKTLKKLIDNMVSSPSPVVQSVEVVCKASQCVVSDFAEKNQMMLHRWPIPVMKGKYDVGVVVSFGCLIPGKIIRMFPHGILNAHASLLPRWRGAAPIIHTILNGDSVSGVSIMKIRPKKFDVGSILGESSVPVPRGCTAMQLHDILAEEGAHLLLHTLSQIPVAEQKPQRDTDVTYAHKPTPDMTYVDWSRQSCDMIDRQYRAFHERVPLKTLWNNQVVKLLDMVDIDTSDDYDIDSLLKQKYLINSSGAIQPGSVLHYKRGNCLMIKCTDGWVAFRKIIKGKTMSAQEFHNGYLCKLPTISSFNSRNNYLYDDIYNK
ncbi:methionyl-tRNA formyltransferase, mitochondrial-like, partial [Argonauta hians]